ncbi:HDOD domain-containing protein [Bacterioplanoides sp.]|uniref:HDOD domain-containing protein n=1 Tax=Bacterioplanoides sp. TaxID=2066072 RepID=UPI003AFF63CC
MSETPETNSATSEPENLQGKIDIPAPPAIIETLSRSMADLNTIGKMIAEQEQLATEVVNTINAPCFNLVRNIANIEEAVRFLGHERIVRLATARSLRASFFTSTQSFPEEVWNVANRVAVANVLIAKELKLADSDQAYEIGLFHNIGMALLYNHTSRYRIIIKSAYRHESGAISAFEKHHLGISHAEVSGMLAKRWLLDELAVDVISNHHSTQWINQQFKENSNEELLNLLAMIKLSERISHSCGFIAQAPQNYEWQRVAPAILNYLGLNETQLERLKRQVLEGMKQEG